VAFAVDRLANGHADTTCGDMGLTERVQARLKGQVVGALGWSFVSDLVAKLAVLVVNLAAIAILPPDAFGRFVTLQASALLSVAVWDFGVSPLLTRQIAAGRLTVADLFVEVLRLRAMTLVPALAVLAVGASTVWGTEGLSPIALGGATAYMVALGSQLFLQSTLRGQFRFRDAAKSTTVGRLGMVGFLLVAMPISPPGRGLELLMLSLAAGETLTALMAFRQVRSFHDAAIRADEGHSITFRRSAPFATTSLIQVAYNKFDVVLIAAMSSGQVVGLYGPASRLQDMMLLIPSIASVVLLPYSSRLFWQGENGATTTRALLARLVAATVSVSAVAAAAITWLAPTWIPRIFGQAYSGSVGPVQVIVWSLPLIAFNVGLAAVISGRHKAHYVSVGIASALVALVITDVLLVPAWGATGAAIGATVREVPLAVVLLAGARASRLFGGT